MHLIMPHSFSYRQYANIGGLDRAHDVYLGLDVSPCSINSQDSSMTYLDDQECYRPRCRNECLGMGKSYDNSEEEQSRKAHLLFNR